MLEDKERWAFLKIYRLVSLETDGSSEWKHPYLRYSAVSESVQGSDAEL